MLSRRRTFAPTAAAAIICAVAVGAFVLPATAHAGIFGDAGDWLGNALLSILWGIVVGVFGFFVGVGGLLLDAGVNLFIIYFGQQYTETGLGFVVDEVWVYIRDLFNLTFIFGLIYIGFKLILNTNDSNTKRWLAYLILAALLVNFSLFFTKFVIDLANLLGTTLVTSGFEAQEDGPDWLSAVVGGGEWYAISGEFAQVMGLPSLYNADFEAVAGEDLTLPFIFGSMILFIVAAIVFGAGGLMLLIRFVVLNVYMLLSPFMFIGWVFPQLASITSNYWRGFLGQAFFAPAYLLLLYFSFRLLTGYQTEGTDLAEAFAGEGVGIAEGIVTNLVFFIIVSGFLVLSLVVATKLSEQGANGTMGGVRRLNQYARRTAQLPQRYAGAWAGRNTAGRYGTAYDRYLERRGYSEYNPARQAARSVGSSRYGGAYNFSQQQAANRTAAANRRSFEREQAVNEAARAQQRAQQRAASGDSRGVVDTLMGTPRADQATRDKGAIQARERLDSQIKNARTDEVQQSLRNATNRPEQYRAIVGAMSATQYNALMSKEGEGALSEGEKSRLRQLRGATTEEKAAAKARARAEADTRSTSGPNATPRDLSDEEATREGIRELSDADVETLDTDRITRNVGGLTQSQYESVLKSDNRTESEKTRIREAREDFLKSEFDTDPGKVIKGKPSDVAKLPKRILRREEAAKQFSPNMLTAMRDLDEETRNTIRGNVFKSIKKERDAVRSQLDTSGIDAEIDQVRQRDIAQAQQAGQDPATLDQSKYTKLREERIDEKVNDALKSNEDTRRLKAAEGWLLGTRGAEF